MKRIDVSDYEGTDLESIIDDIIDKS